MSLQPYIAEQERRLFHDQVDWFIRHWAPSAETDPRGHQDFICDLMTVVRDLGMQRGRAFQEVAAEAFKRNYEMIEKSPIIAQMPAMFPDEDKRTR